MTTIKRLTVFNSANNFVRDINEIKIYPHSGDDSVVDGETKDYSSDGDEQILKILSECFPDDEDEEKDNLHQLDAGKDAYKISDAAKWALSERKCSLYSDQLNEIMVMRGASSISSSESRKSFMIAKTSPIHRQSSELGYSELLLPCNDYESRLLLLSSSSSTASTSSPLNNTRIAENDNKSPQSCKYASKTINQNVSNENIVRVQVAAAIGQDVHKGNDKIAIKSISGHHNDFINEQGPPIYLRKCRHSSEFLLARSDKSLLPRLKYKEKR